MKNFYKYLVVPIMLVLTFNCELAFSQNVGINSTGAPASSSSMLDISSIVSGVLIPRMTEAQRDAIVSPATSLLIYQTDNSPGYYYNSGTPVSPVWSALLSNSTSGTGGWGLSGNTSTVAGTDYIGTTDAVDWVIKTNNAERVRVKSAGNVGVGTTSPGSKLTIESGVGGNPSSTYLTTAANAAHSSQATSLTGTRFMTGIGANASPAPYAWIQAQHTDNSAKIISINPLGGNVGIGTNTPAAQLDVYGNIYLTNTIGSARSVSPSNNQSQMEFLGATTFSTGAGMRFRAAEYSGGPGQAELWFGGDTPDDSNVGHLRIYHRDGTGAASELVRLIPSGNFGIGTNSPAEKLHVSGNARISGLAGTGTRMVQADANGTLTDLAAGTAAQVLNGVGSWVDPNTLVSGDISDVTAGAGLTGGGSSGAVTLTAAANNGIHVDGTADEIRLGGTLIEPTTIQLDIKDLIFDLNSTGDFYVVDPSDNRAFTVQDNGYVGVGIGTGSPATALEIGDGIGDEVITVNAGATSGSDEGYFAFEQNGSVGMSVGYLAGNSITSRELRITNGLGLTGAPLVTFEQGGNVGIGTTVPGAKLHIGAFNDNHLLLTSSNNNYGWRIDTKDNGSGDVPYRIYRRTAGVDTQVLTIRNENGNVGIGATAPLTKLDVNGTITSRSSISFLRDIDTDEMRISGGNGFSFVSNGIKGAGIILHGANDAANAGDMELHYMDGSEFHIKKTSASGTTSTKIMVDANGDVGIGTPSNSNYKLIINGKLKTNDINETSDVRLKKDVVTIDKALEKVTRLRGVYFNWRTEEYQERHFEETLQMGVIAQEVEKVIPEVVSNDGDGFKSVEYSKLVGVLIEAIKEQEQSINQLQNENESLKSSIKNLQVNHTERIEQLERLQGLKAENK